ncbi:MAG: tetratricopeptide repeat protein [Magnetovibrionaceae bacterium]
MKQFSERLMSALHEHASGALDRAEVAYETLLAVGEEETATRLHGFLKEEREALSATGPEATLNPILGAGGLVLRHEKVDLAIVFFRRALGVKPGSPAATAALANGLREAGQLEAALSLYRNLAKAQPEKARWHHEIGITLRKLNRMEEAVAALEQAQAMAPEDPDTAWALATTLIQSGPRFGREGEGWALTPVRWRLASHNSTRLDHGLAPWTLALQASAPETIGGVLVWGEQGIGDEIMFAGLLARLADIVESPVVLVSEKNRALFRRSFPLVPMLDPQEPLPPGLTHQIALGDLPGVLCSTEKRIGPLAPWLQAEENRSAILRQAYQGGSTASRPRLVGLCWRPAADSREGLRRTPPFALWRSVLAQPGLRFVNLQPRAEAGEITQLRDFGAEVIHDRTVDPWSDLDAYAAQIKALDLVISVDCTLVHLAGALGVPCWVLLPWPADYRWPRLGGETGWYPSLRLYPVQPDGGWDTLFGDLLSDLEAFAEGDPVPAAT